MPQARPIGYFQKDFGASLLRSSFHLVGPGIDAYGQERNQVVAILRRFVDFPFSFHFDFTDKSDGHLVMSSDRQFSLRDRYTVEVPDTRVGLPARRGDGRGTGRSAGALAR